VKRFISEVWQKRDQVVNCGTVLRSKLGKTKTEKTEDRRVLTNLFRSVASELFFTAENEILP